MKKILVLLIILMFFVSCMSAPKYELVKSDNSNSNLPYELHKIQDFNSDALIVGTFTIWGIGVGITTMLIYNYIIEE